MMIRSFLLVVLMAGVVRTAAAQAQPVEVRHHPDASAEVLWSEAASEHGIYRGAGELLFHSEEGVRRVRLDGTSMADEMSATGSRVAVLLKRTADEPLQLRVFSRDGSLETVIEVPHHRDDRLPQLALPDAPGELVYALPATAEVCFVRAGETECTELFKDADFSLERNVVVDISRDGRYVAVAAQREAAHPEMTAAGNNAFLFLFDRFGSLVWRRPLPQPSVRALAFSPRSVVAVSTYDAYAAADVLQWTGVFKTDGNLQVDVLQGADAFAFGEGEILLITVRRVTALDVSDGSSELAHVADARRQVVSAAAWENGTSRVVLTGLRAYTDGGFIFEDLRLLHLDQAGDIVGEDAVTVPPQRAPRVSVDSESRRTALILDRETHLYHWPR